MASDQDRPETTMERFDREVREREQRRQEQEERERRIIKRSIFGALATLIVLWLVFSCFKVVGVGEVGIITQFGHVTREVQSGFAVKAPWPFERIYTFDIRTQKDTASAEAASQESQDVKATVVTNYHIDSTKVGDLYRTVGTDYKERIIDPAIQEAVKSNTVKFQATDLLASREALKNATLAQLKAKLGERGIVVEDISYTDLTFSSAFSKSIEQKAAAKQDAERAQFTLQKAQLDAQANQVQQAALTEQILEQQAIAKWNGVLPTTVAGQGSVFNIPLSK